MILAPSSGQNEKVQEFIDKRVAASLMLDVKVSMLCLCVQVILGVEDEDDEDEEDEKDEEDDNLLEVCCQG